MISVNFLVYIIIEGLYSDLNSCYPHREHVVDMATSRPVGPGLNCNPNVFDGC